MKTFPVAVASEKNKKTSISPAWVFQFKCNGVDYFISDSIFTIPAFVPPAGSKWPVSTPVTTLPWVKSWGQVKEGITSNLNEFKISDYTLTCLADRSVTPNIYDLATQNELETNTCSLYMTFLGANIPQEMFRGYIKDTPCPSDYEVQIVAQDESYKLQHYIGTKVTTDNYPWADPDDVGKVIPIVFGSVCKFPALAVNAGVKTSLNASVPALATTMVLSDATGVVVGMNLQVDEEEVHVTAKAGDAITVTRGSNGTLAAVHSSGAVVWEMKDGFDYVVADHPVAAIPKAYCKVGDTTLDISMLCTVWPSGNHPSYPGKAIITVPGYITVAQAVSLAIADGITVSNGTIDAVLGGNVTRTGNATLLGDVTRTGSVALSGGVARTGSVSLSGLVALLGGISDPGHSHYSGQSTTESPNMSMPTAYPAATAVSFPSGTWGMVGNPTVWGLYVPFPADGARSQCTYNITLNFNTNVDYVRFYFCVGGVIRYTIDLNIRANSPWSCSVSSGSDPANNLYILSNGVASNQFRVDACTRTLTLNNLLTSNDAAAISNTLAASNGSLAVIDGSGLSNNLGISDQIGVDNTLVFTDNIGVVSTLAASLAGSVAKSGTVSLSGNSVANTLVGDKLLCDVVSSTTLPGDCFSFLASNYCHGNISAVSVVGSFPSTYRFNGAITEYKKAMEWFTIMALHSRSYFRMHLGVGKVIVRPDVLVSSKTIQSCVVKDDGTRAVSRAKTSTSDVVNMINFNFDRNWGLIGKGKTYNGLVTLSDPASIAVYGELEQPSLFNCDFITDYATAYDVALFYITKNGWKKWLNSFQQYLDMSELEFADGVLQQFLDNKVGEVQQVQFTPGDVSKMDTITIVTKA